MGGRRKTINCTGSGSGSGSRCTVRNGSGAEACICILMPPRTGPQQSQRGKSKQMRLQTVKMAARLGQARAGQGGTLVLGSTCSRGQFDRQQAKCQCPAWPARPGLACGTFPPLSLLDYTLCVPRGFSVLCTFCRLLLCASMCVCVWGGWNFHECWNAAGTANEMGVEGKCLFRILWNVFKHLHALFTSNQ